jgi:nucleotidyltransferase/DNA polymerase involved in DNA repair
MKSQGPFTSCWLRLAIGQRGCDLSASLSEHEGSGKSASNCRFADLSNCLTTASKLPAPVEDQMADFSLDLDPSPEVAVLREAVEGIQREILAALRREASAGVPYEPLVHAMAELTGSFMVGWIGLDPKARAECARMTGQLQMLVAPHGRGN